jgi:intein-encoded DNA endonuclease-like protein
MGVIFMGVVGIKISKRGERRKYLPLEVRIAMHDDVLRLHREGLSYSQLMEKIYEKYGKQLPLSTISHWVNKIHNPLGRLNKFNEKPSPELAYIIGVILSDGYKYIGKKFQYNLRLAVNDREFTEKFAECLTKVLGKKRPYKPSFDRKRKRWIIVGCSIRLFEFLNRPLKELKTCIEYDKDCVSAFLRALFDAEGSIYVKIRGRRRERILRLYNTNRKLLNYTKYLLKKHFDIDSLGPHLKTKSGEITHFPNGKIIKTNEDCYYIYIRAKSLLNFYRHVGFSIKRKQQRLIKAIK